jgi:hypothetical protein
VLTTISTIGLVAFGVTGGVIAHRALPTFRAMVAAITDPEERRDRCPACGGTDYFDGYGVCQECEIM